MSTGQYPFIDIAVHERIRTHFAAGNAAVVLSPTLSEVFWVNGAGARLFGRQGIYDFVDTGLDRSTASFRQIAAAAHAIMETPDNPSRHFVMRTGSDFRRSVVPATLERIVLADDSRAMLLTVVSAEPADTAEAQAACIVDGFAEMETHAAVLDSDGAVLSATPSFERLKLERAERSELVAEAASESDRLVKRPVPTAIGLLPAAVARITDALYFLLAIEMPVEAAPPEREMRAATTDRDPGTDAKTSSPMPSILSLASTGGNRRTASHSVEPSRPQKADAPFAFDRTRPSIRFVWKIDKSGLFSDISPEFAEAVGPNAADIAGRTFGDIAQVFNLDPDHAIGDLLQRRDTWSGKTVLWPVQGTDLRVPVDLAALPTYSRDREFDGFRGFGVVRSTDAEIDPERIGLALVANTGGSPSPLFDTQAASLPDEADGMLESDAPESQVNDGRETGTGETEKDAEETADKVIRLEERRSRSRDGLTASEKQAFREIAERLGRPANESEDTPVAATEPEAAAPGGSAEPPDRVSATSVEDNESPAPDEPAAPRKHLTADTVDLMPVPLAVHDGSTVFRINEDFRLLTGYLSADHLNEAGGMKALFGDDDAASVDDDAASVDESGRLTVHLADGQTVSARALLRSVGWEDGHALMLALTEIQRPEADTPPAADTATADRFAALRIEAEELRSILETATDGVVLLDNDGLIRSMNRSAAALFDYDDNETRGQPFAMLFADESQRAVQDYFTGLKDGGVASVLNDGRDVIGKEASGGTLPLFMTIGHLPGSSGYCAVMRDITQWKRAEEDLQAARREAETASSHKSAFLARVSHEIRTPLNAIIGFAELMAEQRFGDIGNPRYLEYANDIGRSGRHVLDIVNDLLDISKIEAGEQELNFEPVSLNGTLLDAMSILQTQANNRRVIVRTSLSPSVPDVIADRRSIKQIAINLLANAIRFTEAGGQVVVSTAYDADGSVSLRISDTGVGMTRDELEQAMKPFRQVIGSGRKRGEGTGLGLPLAKAMAEANRAQFAMNSQPGHGTLVEIVFPAQQVLAG